MYKKVYAVLTSSERQKLPGIIVLMFIGMLLEVAGIGLIIPAIMVMTHPNIQETYPVLQPLLSKLGNPSQSVLVISGVACLLLVYCVKATVLTYIVKKQTKFVFGVQASLSERLFTGYLLQPWTFHLQRNSSELIQNATTEVSVFIGNILLPSMQLLTEGTVLLGVGLFLFTVESSGALAIVSILGGAGYISQKIIRKKILHCGKERQYHEGLRLKHLQQGLGGAKDVKILGREPYFFEQYEKHNQANADVSQKYKVFVELPRIWLEFFLIVSLLTLVLVVVFQGKMLDTLLPTLALFAAAAFRIMPSLNRVMVSFNNVRYGIPTISRIYQELQALQHLEIPVNIPSLVLQKELVLSNICYAYPDDNKKALQQISLTIPYGKTVGFIGMSGAGKSTLIDIILGLIRPDSGSVITDGVDIQTNQRGWQKQIGYVPQFIFLTDDTIRKNIAFGIQDELINDASIERAIKAAMLEDFIDNLPEGIETLVGERGVRLSGGQRQRIGIARALYHDPSVLVLDEATSSLDTMIEKEVMQSVYALHGNKTILIVAHRLSTVAKCDWIYRIEHGEVVNQGRFEDVTESDLDVLKKDVSAQEACILTETD